MANAYEEKGKRLHATYQEFLNSERFINRASSDSQKDFAANVLVGIEKIRKE